MKQRMTAAVRLATVLVVVVMGISLSLTVNMERDASFLEDAAWSVNAVDVQSLQVIDLDADGLDDLFVQTTNGFVVYDGTGEEMWGETLAPPISTTMGDVNGDGAEDLVSFQRGGHLRATSGGQVLWENTVQTMPNPARIGVVRFNAGTQVVVGDPEGRLGAFSGVDGSLLWGGGVWGRGAIRGLDDLLLDGDRMLVTADRAGLVAVWDPTGERLWETFINGLRRMRTFDVDGDGRSEVYFGGEQGTVFVRDAAGEPLWSHRIGQQVVEIRDGELDGDPSSREVVVGGRDGGVFALDSQGLPVWSAVVGDRVSDVTTLDLDDDGADEVVVGDESGGLTVFAGGSGLRFNLDARSGGVTALDEGRLTASDQVVVSAGRNVSVLSLAREDAPFFYSPLMAGLIVSLAIAGAALFVGGLPEDVPAHVTVTDKTDEGLLARKRMLHENIADVDELRTQGELGGAAAMAKLESLRRQLADVDRELRAKGVNITPESMKCPNCGGRVRLGSDQCDYCGEVVIA